MRFSSQVRAMPGSWSVTLTLDVLTDAMLANQLSEHAHRVQQIWRDSTWTLTLPLGHSAAARNRAFGLLPSPKRPSGTSSPIKGTQFPKATLDTLTKPEPESAVSASAGQMEKWRIDDAGSLRDSPRRRVRRSSRSRSSKSEKKLGPLAIVGIVIAVLFFGLLILALIAKLTSS